MEFCSRVISREKGRERNTAVSRFKDIQTERGQVTRLGLITEVWDLGGPRVAGADLRVPVILGAGEVGVRIQGSRTSHQAGEQHRLSYQFCPLNNPERELKDLDYLSLCHFIVTWPWEGHFPFWSLVSSFLKKLLVNKIM